MTGHTCPECGGKQDAGIRPDCACGAGTARLTDEEQRTARSAETAAEIAAAEDFDPLRIRPYVTLSGDGAPSGAASGASREGESGRDAPDAAATTMPLFLTGAAAGPLPGAAGGDESRRRTAGAYVGGGPDPVQPRRRRPFAALAVGAAVAAVVTTAAFAGGLFGGDDAGGEKAALPDTTAGVADTSEEPARSVSPSPSASPSSSPSASASASASPSASASASPSRSPEAAPSASATLSASATPSPSAPAPASATPTEVAPPAEGTGPTLSRGDHGEDVEELQHRLRKMWLYDGPADGDYTDRVENGVREFQRRMSIESDPPGVYGPETRQTLEAWTSGRDRDRS